MQEAPLITKAKALIQSAKGARYSLSERQNQAIILAGIMIEEAQRIQTHSEKKQQTQLAGMMNDPTGKVFATTLTDQCFRSHRAQRVADQIAYVIKNFRIPSYLPAIKRVGLHIFAKLGSVLSFVSVPLTIQMIRQETSNVILPGEKKALIRHMNKRRHEGVRINLNHLGEAILGEEEARHRLNIYLNDLAQPEIEYISVKISTIFSQINLLAWEDTLIVLGERLRLLYRCAMTHRYIRPNGQSVAKFVNLDMEEYRDLRLTVTLFRRILDEPEFHQYEAGIVLQSYLPDSFLIQQELTVWAMQRLTEGGAPIKIRIVKGANLAMEQFESALRLWPQAPYTSKFEVDANYKRMVIYGCTKEHASVVHLGIASHNLFDIAFALLLRAENHVEHAVCFEMLEGMADHMRRVVQQLAGDMLLYCPAATKEEFQNAVAYLVRRLDENTAPENFLRQAFDLHPSTSEWAHQAKLFSDACFSANKVSFLSRRTQDRSKEVGLSFSSHHFTNEPDTDWTLPQNRIWAENILNQWKSKEFSPIPLVIDGKTIVFQDSFGVGEDPSYPGVLLYKYTQASEDQVDQALTAAKITEKIWSVTSVKERSELLSVIAHELRLNRSDLIGVMVADTGKTVPEADVEISEAIDFAEYYAKNLEEWHRMPDIEWEAKGTVLIAPPWNFPCSISAGGILAALATGNCVIFKPPAEAVLVGWQLAQIFWEAGVSQQVLQFITCEDDPVGSHLIKDPRLSLVVLTGATETAKLFLKMNPALDLVAETGGKNTMVITGLSDRDLAIKDLIQSAFGHAGQKCSACSLAILEAEVYDDPHFLKQLKDATQSLEVSSPWNLKTKMSPLIGPPNATLLRGLTQLDPGEEWLLKPKQDSNNPYLWSPGIKLGVRPESFSFQNEFFGPVLGLVRAVNVEEAFEMMNQTAYGLTAGIHSLDEREQKAWLEKIEAGNCYINRTTTGAIVERQPFGGCKNSSFGKGFKAGGPNYLVQFMHAKQIEFPMEASSLNVEVERLSKRVEKQSWFSKEIDLWKASIQNYAFYYDAYFSHAHDPCLVLGQDNLQDYVSHKGIVLRGQKGDAAIDLIRVIAAALTCHTPLEVSLEDPALFDLFDQVILPNSIKMIMESDSLFIQRLLRGQIKRIRLLTPPSEQVQSALASSACHLNLSPVMANGRLELLHLLRERSISRDYHRYGNLGIRENEKRHPLVDIAQPSETIVCGQCDCYA